MDIKEMKRIIDLVIKSDLAEFEYEEEGKKIKIVRGYNPQIQFPISAPTYIGGQAPPQQITSSVSSVGGAASDKPAGESAKVEHYEQITSPMVGTFYRQSAPDADPFAEVGQVLNVDQTVCIIEAMKLMNEIKSEFKCKVIEVLVENGHAVEFGQPLFKVEKL